MISPFREIATHCWSASPGERYSVTCKNQIATKSSVIIWMTSKRTVPLHLLLGWGPNDREDTGGYRSNSGAYQSSPPGNTLPTPPYRSYPRQIPDVICHKCLQPGHFSRNCQEPQVGYKQKAINRAKAEEMMDPKSKTEPPPTHRQKKWAAIFNSKCLNSGYKSKGAASRQYETTNNKYFYDIIFGTYKMHGAEGESAGYSRNMKRAKTTTYLITKGRECKKDGVLLPAATTVTGQTNVTTESTNPTTTEQDYTVFCRLGTEKK